MTVETAVRENIFLKEEAPSPLGKYPHAVRAGDYIFLSGQGARNPKTGDTTGITLDAQGEVSAYDMTVQTHSVIKNILAVTEASGCTIDDLVDITVFLRDMKDFDAYNKVYGEYFNIEHPPARTTVESRPPGHNYIEIKATAYKPLKG